MTETVTRMTPSTKERPKPEKPGELIDLESERIKRRPEKPIDTDSVLADALELVKMGQLSSSEIDSLESLDKNQKMLLRVLSELFERLGKQSKKIIETSALLQQMNQKKDDGATLKSNE